MLLATSLLVSAGSAQAADRLSLAGDWRFAQGEPAAAFPQGALPTLAFHDRIALPGTTETRGKGPENAARETHMLTRVRKFDGVAWYERDVEIPAAWTGRRVTLRLERTKYTQLWIDGQPAGEHETYTAEQVYDLTAWATPGSHRLTLMVDNRPERRPLKGDAHQFSDNTQTNWNGVIGMIELLAQPRVWIEDVQVHPSLDQNAFRVRVLTGRGSVAAEPGRVRVTAESFNHAGAAHRPAAVEAPLASGDASTELVIPLGAEARRWDEFSPALYRVTVTLETPQGQDERSVETGLREFRTRDGQFTINGRTTFLRGKHDGCVFPLTGHPPMDVQGWLDYLTICQRYGINHVRCHTWVPPEAAFAAADRLGMYLQPELPYWGGFDAGVHAFLAPQAAAVLRAYGNHPSFVMFTLGNELSGDREIMNAFVADLRKQDGRHLYADGSNNYLWAPRLQPTSDFWPTAKTITASTHDRAVPARGSFYFADGYDGVVQWGPSSTRMDLREANRGVPAPVVGHEIGQFTTYPDFREIERYRGVTRARNLERFRNLLARNGMVNQAHDFFRASGALAASLYREEIELALRTPGFGGFQLLDLQDFPGQGTALVGVLNAFMESKGAVTEERWREFCGPVVPLARFDRYTWTKSETYRADLELAHYGADSLRDAQVEWSLVGADGAVLAKGEKHFDTVAQGGLRSLGAIEAKLAGAKAPARYDLRVSVAAANVRVANRWPVWVYPDQVVAESGSEVDVVHAFDADAKQRLAAGRRVVLIPHAANWGETVGGGYATDFWCWPMFVSAPGTMGILCDPRHPALAAFPTAQHSERQWATIVHRATPVLLTGTPADLRPIVQVIDNLERNEKIGLVFEARVGRGSLLVVGCDLSALHAAPEARQLWSSLLAYARSPRFAPRQEVSERTLDVLLRPSLAHGGAVTVSSFLKPEWGPVPEAKNACDGDITTRWQAAANDATPWCQVDLGKRCTVDTLVLRWQQDEAGYRYLVEGSEDGTTWKMVSDQRQNDLRSGRHVLAVNPAPLRFVRVTVAGAPNGRAIALNELRVLGAPAR